MLKSTNRVMPGLVPGIHAMVCFSIEEGAVSVGFLQQQGSVTAWMPGTRPGMTARWRQSKGQEHAGWMV
jgi:hypothetical protein